MLFSLVTVPDPGLKLTKDSFIAGLNLLGILICQNFATVTNDAISAP